MKTIMNVLLVSMMIITVGNLNALSGEFNATGTEKAVKTLTNAVMVLDDLMKDTGNGIPQNLINTSGGIVILPAACRTAAGAFNGRGGTGIAMVRNENGCWSRPLFVTIREGNLGHQIGTQASDIVLLFKDSRDIMNIEKTEITLGDNIGIAAGPGKLGMSSAANTTFVSEVYSYQRSEGVFMGENLKGGILSHYAGLSNSFYGVETTNRDELFSGYGVPYNEQVNETMEEMTISGE